VHQLTPERQFAALLAAEPARPFVTYYDEQSGERSELSAKSLANWVAKTHHLLIDELGLGPGDSALLAVPAHWISVPVLLGCLTAGLALTEAAGDASVAFVTPETLPHAAGIPDVYAVRPERAAAGFGSDAPAPALDYVGAVRPQADAWASVQMPGGENDPCLAGMTRGETAKQAAAMLAPGTRLLVTQPWTSPTDWVNTLLAPIAAGGSLVIVANCADEAVLARRAEQERVTARA
jgi:uncharacterized protein (TIGR03089 family)